MHLHNCTNFTILVFQEGLWYLPGADQSLYGPVH